MEVFFCFHNNFRQINANTNATKSNQFPITALAKINIAGNSLGTTESERITLIVDDTRFLIDIGKEILSALQIVLFKAGFVCA